jgi:hypothetical protein
MPQTAVHEDIIQAAKTVCLALHLPQIDQNVYDQDSYAKALIQYPCLLLMGNGTEQVLGGTNLSDDIGYPVAVFFFDRRAPEDGSNKRVWKQWRQAVRNAFIMQRLAGVDLVYKTLWEPGAIIDPAAMKAVEYQAMVGSMTLRFVTRELRGANHP